MKGNVMNNSRTIMRYHNRRLYDRDEHRYVTLADICALVVEETRFVVIQRDNKQDITDRVLLQALFEQELSAKPVLSREFLLQAIRSHEVAPSGGARGNQRGSRGLRAESSVLQPRDEAIGKPLLA
jgi:polyhydroxyalkanoate synthesis repressor PhaR